MRQRAAAAAFLAATLLLMATHAGAATPRTDARLLGRTPPNPGRPPVPFINLGPADAARFQLGLAVFNTQWVPEGVPDAGRRDGLGPHFVSAACDACHNSGSRGRGPAGDGPLPQELVLQLGGATGGDPAYGSVLSTGAVTGTSPEASVAIRYSERPGQFADGTGFSLRVPELQITDLKAGGLDPATVLKPRLAPAVFGVGLLEAVPDSALRSGADPADGDQDGISGRVAGRLGWQGGATAVREQTARAFAREMGLTSTAMGPGDCQRTGNECGANQAATPEVGDELLEAVVYFQQVLGVPAAKPAEDGATAARGQELFNDVGCTACHRLRLPVQYRMPDGNVLEGSIAAYSDLLVHDLGPGLADRTVAGRIVASEWRTAPLWGQRAGLPAKRAVHLLHDGRARSVTEAVLWHEGEAAASRDRFTRLRATDRDALTRWVDSR